MILFPINNINFIVLLVHSKSVLSKYSKKVFVSSKAAIVILLWNFAINLVYIWTYV